jgi:TP901 family phage tail tape measure protein
MADVNANIGVHIDTSAALAELKNLQRQLATFHSSVAKNSAASAAAQKNLQTNLLNSINATGKFSAQMGLVRTSTESFTHALEKNKLSMREYFRYAGGSTRTFGQLFKQEFDTIGKVAEERVKKMQTQYIKMGRDASGAMRAMAITPRSLDMNDYATKTALAAQKQAMFNQLVRQGSTNLLNFGKNTQWAGRQLMVGFTVPLAYFGTAAAKTFMDLEAQAIKFKRVYGDMFTTTEETTKALGDIEQIAKEFTKYGVAAVKTMELASQAAAMGKTGADLTAQVVEANRLAVLGGVEQTQALETTISVTNAFGIAAEDLAKKIDFLNAVENQTVVSIEDLTIAIPKAGPVVKQLGGDVEDLAFFLTAMKEGGINASEGANALKSGLASLINPTKKASDMLAGFGINIKAIVEGNQGNIRQTVIDFSRALDTLDPLNRARAIEQLFGKFQFSRLSTLFQNVTKDGTQASRVLQLAGSSIEQLAILSERELKTVEDSVGVQFKAAVEELKLAIAPIGKTFLQAVTPIVKVIGNLLENFNGLSDGTKKFIVIASTLVGIIGPTLLMTFGLVANGVANIIKMFLALRVGFLKLGGNSKVLAQQTDYLNTEQMEAATVAASLNQAHTRLTQSFTAEASAVRLLRQAYIDATVAAANFARANPGMMMPGRGGATPKKFAKGTPYVPGTGTGDTVASLLTPGEAVIPRDIAQNPKFQPLIEALVSGQIKKYKKGSVNVGDDYSHVGGQKNLSIDELLKDQRISPLEKQKLEVYKQVLLSQGKPATIGSYGSLAYSFDSKMNKALAKGGVPIDSFEKAWTSRGAEKWMSSNIPPSQAKLVDDAILKQIKSSGATVVTDGMVERAFKNLPPEIKALPAYSKMDSLHSQLGSYGIGRGLGSNPKTSEAILAEAKRKGYIKDYKIETRTTSKGALGTKSIIITNNDGTQVNLGRGSKTNRQYVSDTQSSRRRSGVVTGQTGTAKPGRVTTTSGAPSEKRQVAVGKNETILNKKTTAALKSGKPVFVPGLGRFRMINSLVAGAQDGLPTGQKSGSATSGAGSQSAQLSRAQLMAATEGTSLKEAKRRIAAESRLTNAIDESTKAQITTKEKLQQFSQKAGVGIGAVSGLTIAASFAGGKVGEMAQAIMPFVFGLQGIVMLLPLLANPWVAAVAAIAVLGGVTLKMVKDIENARKEGVNLAKAMSMTSEKLQSLSELSGTVSASEEAARRRTNILSGSGEGQRQFGQNVLQSDFGKQILADIETQSKSGQSIKEISQNLANNLAVAVAQGAVTTSQARSISAALGEELGSYEIPALVSGKLVSLLGPNGENLSSDPLQVTLQIQQDSMKRQATSFKAAVDGAISESTAPNFLAKAAGIGLVVAGAATGIASAIAAIPTGGLGAAGFVPAGSMVTAGLVSAGFGVADENSRKAVNVKLAAAAVELGVQEVAQNQGLVDSLNRQYDIKLKSAKTESDIKRIQDERKAGLDKLNSSNANALNLLVKQRDQLGEDSFTKGIKAAADAMYKEGPMVVFKDQALEQLNNLKKSKFKTQLQVGLASGQVSPTVITKILSTAAGDKGFKASFNLLVNKQGLADAALIADLLPSEGGTDSTRKLMVDYINNNKEEFDKDIQALTLLNQINPTYGITLDLKANGVEQLATTTNALKQIEGLPSTLTKDIVAKLAEEKPGEWKAFYDQWDILSEGKDTVNKNIKVAFDVVSNDPNFKGFGAAAGKSSAEIIAKGGFLPTEIPGGGITPPDSGAPKARDTTLDNILNRLKMVREQAINATGGIKELLRVTGGKGLTQFGGVMQDLLKGSPGGINREFLDFINQMDNATRKTYLTEKNGIAVLTAKGKALKEAYDEAIIGEYQYAQQESLDAAQGQLAALQKLKAAGVPTAQAVKMVADAALAVAINSKNISSKEILNMAAAAKLAEDRVEALALAVGMATPEGRLDLVQQEAAFANEYFDAMGAMIEQQREASPEYQALTSQIDAQTQAIENANNQIDGYQSQIDSIQRDLETNAVYGSRVIDNLNDQIDTLNRTAEINFDRPIAALNDESNVLSNTLSLIDKAEEGINKKYDAQQEALSKISQLNSDIAAQERQRLTLADALSQGDISAAAVAAQDMRTAAAEAAARNASGTLDAARQGELEAVSVNGMTRTQIQERQFQISQQMFALEQQRKLVDAQILAIQDQIYIKEQLRLPQIAAIKNLQDQIYNVQVNQLIPAQQLLDKAVLAKNAHEKMTEELISQLTYLERTPAKWNEITVEMTAAQAQSAKIERESKETAKAVKDILDRWEKTKPALEKAAPPAKTLKDITDQTATRAAALLKSWEALNATFTTTHIIITKNVTDDGSGILSTGPGAGGGPTGGGWMYGGKILPMNYGGMVPKYMARGGAIGSDTVPAMLTPGEFVMNKAATKRFGPMLESMNNSKFPSMIKDMTPAVYSSNNSSVVMPTVNSMSTTVSDNSSTMYNYNIGITVPQSNANSNDIARAVIGQIKYIDSQRIRGNR